MPPEDAQKQQPQSQQPQQPNFEDVAAALAAGTAASTVATGSPAAAGAVTGALSAAAVTQTTQAVVKKMMDWAKVRWNYMLDPSGPLAQTAKDEYPNRNIKDVMALLDEREREFEREFRRKMAKRLQEDIPKALRLPTMQERKDALKRIFEREKRYTAMREEAILARAMGALEAELLKDISPEGAYWKLSPTVKEHTLDCLAMGEKFWPWSVLRKIQPPLHYGCPCYLLGLDEAIEAGLMTRDQVPDESDARERYAKLADQIDDLRGLDEQAVQELHEIAALNMIEEVSVRRPLRWAKGFVKGGQFRPTRGGASARARVLSLPESPTKQRGAGRGRWTWVGGRYTKIPEADSWTKQVGGKTYHSPPGGTNVYRDGTLLNTPGEPAPVTERRSPGTLATSIPEVLQAKIDAARTELRQKAAVGRGIPPVSKGDDVSAVLSLEDAGYTLLDSKRTAPDASRMLFKNSQGTLEVQVGDKDGVRDITWTPAPATRNRVALTAPAQTWQEHSSDALAFADELGKRFGADVKVPSMEMDTTKPDHAGTHLWTGEIKVGKDAGPDIEKAARKRAEGKPLTDREKRGVYSTYWVTGHEVAHGINPIPPMLFKDPVNANLEEALAEEFGHTLAIERLARHGQYDVIEWRRDNPNALPVRGVYPNERYALQRILDEAKIPQRDRQSVMEAMKFRMKPEARVSYLATLHAAANGGNISESTKRINELMRSPEKAPATFRSIINEPDTYGYRDEGGWKANDDAVTEAIGAIDNGGPATVVADGVPIVRYNDGSFGVGTPHGSSNDKLTYAPTVEDAARVALMRSAFAATYATDYKAMKRREQTKVGTGSPREAVKYIKEFASVVSPQSPGIETVQDHVDGVIETRKKVKRERRDQWGFGHVTPKEADKIAELVEDASLVVRMPPKGLNAFLKDGEMKTSTDTNKLPEWQMRKDRERRAGLTNFGANREYVDDRRAWEDKLFGAAPVYGYFRDDDASKGWAGKDDYKKMGQEYWTQQYGDVVVELDDSLKDRTSYTIGDSIDSQETRSGGFVVPMPVGEGNPLAVYPLGANAPDIPNLTNINDLFIAKDPPKAEPLRRYSGPGSVMIYKPIDAKDRMVMWLEPEGAKGYVPSEDYVKVDGSAAWDNAVVGGASVLPHYTEAQIFGPRPTINDVRRVIFEEPESRKVLEAGEVVEKPVSFFGPTNAQAKKLDQLGIPWEFRNRNGKVLKKGKTPYAEALPEPPQSPGWGWFDNNEQEELSAWLPKGKGKNKGKGYKPKKKPSFKPKVIGGKKDTPRDNGTPFPDYNGEKLTTAKFAGGSNGALWANDEAGNKWLVKTYRGDEDRIATELVSNRIYALMGATVPAAGTIEVDGKTALTYEALDGQVRHGIFKKDGPNERVGEHYMTDALLANWDFAGMTDDNILWDGDEPIRVDQGGTLEFRAMGDEKPFGPIPSDVWTMIRKGQAKRASKVTEPQMREQAAQIAATLTPDVIDGLMDDAPFADAEMRNRVRDSLKARVEWMSRFANGDEDIPPIPEGPAVREEFKTQETFEVFPEEINALKFYALGGALPVQEHLRSKSPDESVPKSVTGAVSALDAMLKDAKTPEDVIVYVPVDKPMDDVDALVGKTVEERGFIHATTDVDAATGDGAMVRLLIPAGSHVLSLDAIRGQVFDTDEPLPDDAPELIIRRGSRLKMTGIDTVDGAQVLDATLLPPKRKPVGFASSLGKASKPSSGASKPKSGAADQMGLLDVPDDFPEPPQSPGVNPVEPVTLPIPKGHVRLFHQTDLSPEEIRRDGLKAQKPGYPNWAPAGVYASEPRKHTNGEGWFGYYNNVFGTEGIEKPTTVEFSVPKAEWEKNFDASLPRLERDILPEEIVAIHRADEPPLPEPSQSPGTTMRLEMPVADPASIVPALREEIEAKGVKVGSPGDAVVVTYRPDSYRAVGDPETVDKTVRSRLTPEREALFLGAIRDSLNRYPGVADSLDEVTFGTSPELGAYDETRAAQTRNVFFTDRPGAMFLRFDPVSAFDSEPIISLSASQMVFNDLLPPNERVQQKSEETAATGIGKGIVAVSEYGVGLHEFGHAIVEVARRRDGSNPFDGVDDKRLGTETRFEFDGWQPFVRHGITPQEVERTSRYATSKPEEAFAEMFTAYELGLLDDEVAGKFDGLLAELLGVEPPQSPGTDEWSDLPPVETGKPVSLQMWHGSSQDEIKRIRPGLYLTTDKNEANDYGTGGTTFLIDADFKKPKVYDDEWPGAFSPEVAELKKQGYDAAIVRLSADDRDPTDPVGNKPRYIAYVLDPSSVTVLPNPPRSPGTVVEYGTVFEANDIRVAEPNDGWPVPEDYLAETARLIEKYPVGGELLREITPVSSKTLGRDPGDNSLASALAADVIRDDARRSQTRQGIAVGDWPAATALIPGNRIGQTPIIKVVVNDYFPETDMREALERSANTGFSITGTFEGIATHEFGHVLAHARTAPESLGGRSWTKAFDLYEWEVLAAYGIEPFDVEQISEYATTTPEEGFAEMFAAYELGLLDNEPVKERFQAMLSDMTGQAITEAFDLRPGVRWTPPSPLDWKEGLHPRDRKGRWRDKPGSTLTPPKMGVTLPSPPQSPGTKPADKPAVREVDAETFHKAFQKALAAPRGSFLTDYSVEDFKKMKTFLSEDGTYGGAVKTADDGVKEAVSLFNVGDTKGGGMAALKAAVDGGATRLDCLGEVLRKIYSTKRDWGHFEVSETIKWDDQYAPEDWDYDQEGRPNIYVMTLVD